MRIASAIICLSLSFAWVPFACSSQAEGQRCNADNGNDDCEEGLVCWSSRELGGNADICCPANLNSSSAPDCQLGGASASSTSSGGGGGVGGAGGGSSTSSGGGMGGDGGGGGPSSSTASAMGGGGMSQGGGGMSQGGGGAGGN